MKKKQFMFFPGVSFFPEQILGLGFTSVGDFEPSQKNMKRNSCLHSLNEQSFQSDESYIPGCFESKKHQRTKTYLEKMQKKTIVNVKCGLKPWGREVIFFFW